MARSTVFRYKGSKADPRNTGRELNVEAVLTGRLLQRGNALLVTAELVDVANGWQLWSKQYDRQAQDILSVQDEIAQEISESLRLSLSPQEKKRLTRRPTQDTEAYHLYLKGRYCWNKRTSEDIQRGIGFFKRAIEKDPNFALAHAGLSDSYYLLCGTSLAGLLRTKRCRKRRRPPGAHCKSTTHWARRIPPWRPYCNPNATGPEPSGNTNEPSNSTRVTPPFTTGMRSIWRRTGGWTKPSRRQSGPWSSIRSR